ncbi:hypothetical protein F4779DRAFT_185172 [Xylariaceae sp. FL0662B]|nr:hypothetical protein F4779DRAFT_185172 [Xylariaceae sp. FL0662B]
MCHGHPHYHPCSHTSVKWLYCPEAPFDLETGYETPCSNPIYSAPQPTNVDCPLQNCNFKALMGSWNCCVCGRGPNTQGWCTVLSHRMEWNPLTDQIEEREVPCGHGCCSKCSPAPSSRATSPEVSFESRKGKSSRKHYGSSRGSSHRRGSAYEYGESYAPINEEGEQAAASSSTAPSARGSRKSSHDANTEYSSKRSSTHSGKKKSHKSRSHH